MAIGFLQDDFKVTPKLTLTWACAYDIRTCIEKYDRFSKADTSVPEPRGGRIPGALVFAGTKYGPLIPTDPRWVARRCDTRYYMWQPRFGFAYQLNKRTVVRAAMA